MQATARAQPNIALIKYWGKRDLERNLPAAGSLSVTLADLYTEMEVCFDPALAADQLSLNGDPAPRMLPRISRSLDAIAGPGRARASVVSRCNFPVAAGLASSASAFAALAVAASNAAGKACNTHELACLAGLASGSAARSLYGGFVELRNTPSGIDVATLAEAEDWPLRVVVAITTADEKPVSSGDAMEISRQTSPFYNRWIAAQEEDLALARRAVAECDFSALAAVAEHNCLKMHSVMWASRPAMVYWNSATLNCLQCVRDLQAAGVNVFFTIDAGPQLKAVCTADAEATVSTALRATPGVKAVMSSGLGPGAGLMERAC